MVALTFAQRPSYASSGPIGRPGLASRFKDDNASSTTVAVVNRVGEDGSTQKIPVDARGDVDLVNTLNTWEREHQPFWLLNADHIEKARNTTRGTGQISNRDQFNSQNSQGTSNNGNQNIGNQSNGKASLSSRLGATNSGNQRTPPSNNMDWFYGRPSQGDTRPVYETPERSLGDQRINQGQRNSDGSSKKIRFHYERNNFQ